MTQTPFTITDTAWKRIQHLLTDEPKGTFFRVMIESGGCSGLQYKFDLTTKTLEDDQIFTFEEAEVRIDSVSLGLLGGAQLDYVEEMIGSSFQIKNPNAQTQCGCGSSFGI